MLPENLKPSSKVTQALRDRAHSVYVPGTSASTFLAAWYVAEKLPLGEANNYIALAREWENGKEQTAKAIIEHLSTQMFVSKQMALDYVRRIHQYRATAGVNHVYILLGTIGLGFMDFVEMDEGKKTTIMLAVADALVENDNSLTHAKDTRDYDTVAALTFDTVENKIHEQGFGPRITSSMLDATRVVISRMMKLARYIDSQDHTLLEEWMRPFVREMVEEILNNRGCMDDLVDFIISCNVACEKESSIVGKRYFLNGGL